MPFWRPNSVEDEPSTQAYKWMVYDVAFKSGSTRHVVCYCGEGRVSSPIKGWDPEGRIATTRSGRRYHLNKDCQGFNLDAQYVFGTWCKINKVDRDTDLTDVTSEYV